MAALATLALGATVGWLATRLASRRSKKGKAAAGFEMWPKLASGKHEVGGAGHVSSFQLISRNISPQDRVGASRKPPGQEAVRPGRLVVDSATRGLPQTTLAI